MRDLLSVERGGVADFQDPQLIYLALEAKVEGGEKW